jgi:hypothetical protein
VITKSERSKVEREFLQSLGKRMASFGFDETPSGQSFYWPFESGKWAFHVSFIPHRDDVDLTADVAIRLDSIEDLVNEYDTKRNAAQKRQSMTIGGELGNLSEDRPHRWTLAAIDDIPQVSDQVARLFETVGLPFLKAHSDISTLNRVLSSSDSRDKLLCPLLGPRAMRAIASAHVLDENRDLTLLADQLEARLAEKEDVYLEDFRALRGALSKNRSRISEGTPVMRTGLGSTGGK